MKIIRLYDNIISDRQAYAIAEMLREGEVIVWPTDTLYGIACDALNQKAVDRVCRIKGINSAKNDLSVICANISQASEYTRIDNKAFRLIRNNTPGPFTFLLQASNKLPRALKGRKTIGIRIPDFSDNRKIAEFLGNPVLNTSVSIDDFECTEFISPEIIADRYENLIDVFLTGQASGTKPSTVIDCTNNTFVIIREGVGNIIE